MPYLLRLFCHFNFFFFCCQVFFFKKDLNFKVFIILSNKTIKFLRIGIIICACVCVCVPSKVPSTVSCTSRLPLVGK